MPEGFLDPAYGERSLGDVVPAVARALGVAEKVGLVPPSGLELPPAPAYVVFLIDGLGARQLERYSYAAPYLDSLAQAQAPGTCGVPSTTTTSLTSLGTGLVPGVHGLVGFTSRIPDTDRLLAPLRWDKRVDPLEWQPHDTAFARLMTAGVDVRVVNKKEFRDSGLTQVAHRGARFVDAEKVGERIAAAVEASGSAPSLTYLYDSDLDWTGHKHGVASTPWLQQLSMIDAEAELLRESLPTSTRLLIVADHGMIDCPESAHLDIDEHPQLRDGLVLLGGEARFRHLYCRDGAVADVMATWKEFLGDRAEVLTRRDAVGRGWFGAVDAAMAPRLGDVMVACRGDLGIFSSVDFSYETTLVGLHGSLTHDEMLIPILVD